MPKVTVDDGVVISYDLYDFTDPWSDKESQVVLLNHGSAENRKFFIPMIPALARSYRVVSFDARGRGESTAPPEGSTFSGEAIDDGITVGTRLAKDALSLIDQLDIEKVHWFGVSSGFTIGVIFATSYPERITSLISCSGCVKVPETVLETQRLGEKDMASAIEKLGVEGWWKKLWELTSGTPTGVLDQSKAEPRLVEWELAERIKIPTHVYAAFMRWVENFNVLELLPKIKVPTLLLSPERSAITPLEQQRLVKERIPNAKQVLFEDVGHSIHMVMPGRVTSAVLDFLKTIDRINN